MKENLTPRVAFDYSINRMAEAHDSTTGGPAPTPRTSGRPQGVEGGHATHGARIPPTPERIEAARKLWGPLIEQVADSDERDMMRILAEMGAPPIEGGAMAPVEPETAEDRRLREELDALEPRIDIELLRPYIDQIRNLPPVQEFWARTHQSIGETNRAELNRIEAELTRLRQQTPQPTLEINLLTERRNRLRAQANEIDRLISRQAAERFERITRGEASPEIRAIRAKIEEGEELDEHDREVMNNEIDQLNIATGGSAEDTIWVIATDEEFSQKYLDKILSLPELLPREQYRLGFYESMNLELFLHRVREWDERRATDPNIPERLRLPEHQALERLRRYSDQRGMRQSFHEMRRYMVIGNIRDFAEIARTIAPEYLQRAAEYLAVPTVQRLYDTAFKEVLAGKQTLGSKDFEDIDRQVGQRLRLMSRAGLFGRQLEQWEITRALSVGKNYSVISLRIPELISIGRIQGLVTTMNAISRTFASFDYESVTRFLNPLRWLGTRFDVGGVHGGPEYLNEVYQAMDEANKDPSKLEKIFGLNRLSLERSAPFGQTSFDAGWRTIEAYLNSFKVKTTVRTERITDPIDGEQYEIKVYDPGGETEEVDAGYYFNWQAQWASDAQAKGFDLDEAYRPLIDQIPFYRGLMMKDAPGSAMKTKVELWKRIARDMPNQIMLVLSGDEQFEDIKKTYAARGVNFDALLEKLALYQERRLQQQMEPERVQNGIVTEIVRLDLNTAIPGFEITAEERQFTQEVVDLITNDRTRKAQELAKIRWPSTPVFEDFAYEKADYMKTGAEVFRRRIGGDALALYGAMEETLPTISDPDMKFETFIEHMDKAYHHLDTPFGFKIAQDMMYPFIRARFKFTGEYDLGRRLPLVDDLFSAFGVPLSRAQYYYGREGEALDAFALRQKIEQLVGKGIVRRHKVGDEKDSELTKLRGEVHASLWDITKERLPMGLLLLLIFLTSQAVKSSLKEK